MAIQNHWSLLVAMALPAAVGAQQRDRDEVGVVRAAIEYYRDTRVKGPLVIDPTSVLRRGPAVDPAVVDEAANAARTKKGPAADYIACEDSVDMAKQRKHRVCTMRNDVKAIVTFSELSIRDNTATLVAVYSTVRSGRSTLAEDVLTVIRGTNGRWQVQSAVVHGAS